MASEQKINTLFNKNIFASVAWLLEATARGFVGWLLLNNFTNPIAMGAAIYFLATCVIIVVRHFFNAHK